jgi:CRP-like cAMP-binding protein
LACRSHRSTFPTEALRIDTSKLRVHADHSPVLIHRISAYATVLVAQLAQSAVCARFHTAQQRLCRWLVTAADRAEVSHLPWSHEWIAEMVGGPRSAVSQAASTLRRLGLVDYGRRGIVIRDVTGLRARACECLGIVEDAIQQFSVT